MAKRSVEKVASTSSKKPAAQAPARKAPAAKKPAVKASAAAKKPAAKPAAKSAKKPAAKKPAAPPPVIVPARKKPAGAWSAKAAPVKVRPAPAPAPVMKRAALKPGVRPAGVPVTAFDEMIERIRKRAAKGGIRLGRGASEEEIAAAEKAIGRKLPDEMRAFYRWHNGAGSPGEGNGVEEDRLLSLAEIVHHWQSLRDLRKKGYFKKLDALMDSGDFVDVHKGIQERAWLEEWIPFTLGEDDNHRVIDLAPARGGTSGQVVVFKRDEDSRWWESKSFLTWLSRATWG